MDTFGWSSQSSNFEGRGKETIVTVREILQDSDSADDQTAETSSFPSPRKRDYHEVERNSHITPSIRKPGSNEEHVSPAKRHRVDRGVEQTPKQPEHNDKSRGAFLMETEVTASAKGKERASDTPSIKRRVGSLKTTLPLKPQSISRSGYSRPASSGGYANMGVDVNISAPSQFSSAPSQPSVSDSPKPHTHNALESRDFKYQTRKDHENIFSNIPGTLDTKAPEPDNKYEHISNIFDSLYPSVETWIERQKSELDTVIQEINRILGLIQQGERLQQKILTAEMASEMEDLIDEISTGIQQKLNIHDPRPIKYQHTRRILKGLSQKAYNTADPSQCIIELYKLAVIRSEMGAIENKGEFAIYKSIVRLKDAHDKLMRESEMLKGKDAKAFAFMLQIHLGEKAKVFDEINMLKEEVARFYERRKQIAPVPVSDNKLDGKAAQFNGRRKQVALIPVSDIVPLVSGSASASSSAGSSSGNSSSENSSSGSLTGL